MQVPCADSNDQNTPPSVPIQGVASAPQIIPAVVGGNEGVQSTVCATASSLGHSQHNQPDNNLEQTNEVRINYDVGSSAARGAVLL